ncbi:hypothetical protein SmJEL517_g04774 [Synchytrium microbalum]|uniref:Prefoldin subunit 4 n=1 Tax=Synchytrium microbalum TaxID=1806994 RepID=A0A507BSJ0_9FUNG|nr:uncharacterized protein SmJEL517_g04774 [Synchytrium microbalum]TPX32037.1 hypothetical protein SmJEL517_g04774 [Synchytrium microbalum]
MSMQMASELRHLAPHEETETEVTREDQQNINTFSKLTAKLDDLELVYDSKKKEKEYLDDLVQELELADEDELIKYRIGDSFFSLTLPECMERISKENSFMDTELEDVQTKMSDIQETLQKLKATLYAKFGKAINLDK